MTKRVETADILLGSEKIHWVYFEELGKELPLRALTDGEWHEIETSIYKSMSLEEQIKGSNKDKKKKELEKDFEKFRKYSYEADLLVVLKGLKLEGLTMAKVKQFSPPGINKRIAEEILKISGIYKTQEEKGEAKESMDFFRE